MAKLKIETWSVFASAAVSRLVSFFPFLLSRVTKTKMEATRVLMVTRRNSSRSDATEDDLQNDV